MNALGLTCLVSVCVCVQAEDSGRSKDLCQTFNYLGEGAHQPPGRQVSPRRDVQPVTAATAYQILHWTLSGQLMCCDAASFQTITFKEALTTNIAAFCLSICKA